MTVKIDVLALQSPNVAQAGRLSINLSSNVDTVVNFSMKRLLSKTCRTLASQDITPYINKVDNA